MKKLKIIAILLYILFNLGVSVYADNNVSLYDPVKGDICLWSSDAGYGYVTNTYTDEENLVGITGRTISYSGTASLSSGTLKYKTPYVNSNGVLTNISSRSYWKNNFSWEFDFKLTKLPSSTDAWNKCFQFLIGSNWNNMIQFVAKDEETYYLRWGGGKDNNSISGKYLTTTGTDIYDLKINKTYHLKIEADLVDTGNVYVTFTNPGLIIDGETFERVSVSPYPLTVYSELKDFSDSGKYADFQFKCNSPVSVELSNEEFYVDRFRTVSPTMEFGDDSKSQLKVSASVVNTTPAAFGTRPPALICSVYDKDGVLVKIGCNNNFVGEGIASLAQYDYSVTLSDMDKLSGDDYTVKTFLWNNTSELVPILDSQTVKLSEVAVKSEDIEQNVEVLQVTSDGEIVTKDGNEVVLKGVNFGGWLIQETWMCPVIAFNGNVTVRNGTENGWANLDTLDEMESRFGTEKTAELIKAYQDNYITEWDFENVKNLGFNCVRIPFWYRNFMSDEEGTYITENDDENPGFIKLDWVCEMAEKYGLYLIFDMHGCPGGQNGDHTSGKVGRNYLYKETKYQDIMENLWVKIAARYKDKTCVAAYDIMNEPLNNADANHNVEAQYRADPWTDTTLRVGVYDRMIKAIRKVDPHHIITLEAIWRMDRLPDPDAYGWENMMYQLHSYDADDTTATALVNSLINVKTNYGVAAYMGEFNPAIYNKNVVGQMDAGNVSYTLWNYKTAMLNSETLWGLYHRSYSLAEFYEICGASAFNKLASSWDGVCYSMKQLTNEEIEALYRNWWSNEKLSTQSFTLNSTLKACFE